MGARGDEPEATRTDSKPHPSDLLEKVQRRQAPAQDLEKLKEDGAGAGGRGLPAASGQPGEPAEKHLWGHTPSRHKTCSSASPLLSSDLASNVSCGPF